MRITIQSIIEEEGESSSSRLIQVGEIYTWPRCWSSFGSRVVRPTGQRPAPADSERGSGWVLSST